MAKKKPQKPLTKKEREEVLAKAQKNIDLVTDAVHAVTGAFVHTGGDQKAIKKFQTETKVRDAFKAAKQAKTLG